VPGRRAVISPALLAEVRPLASRFRDAGCNLYLVGGIVRDQELGRPLAAESDIDLTTDAHPALIKKLVAGVAEAVWTQGERFGTIGCLIGGRAFEITTHRGESYDPDSRKPAVVFSGAVEHDLARRDFTVNAMAVSLPDGGLVDPFGGRSDLAAGLLRTPLEPELSFSDDPLRMLRAARFVAGYGLTPDAALLAAIQELAPRMAIVSVERRRDELDKLLAVVDPRPGLRLLVELDLAPYVLPDLARVPPAVIERTLDAVAQLPSTHSVRLAALLAVDDEPQRPVVAARLRGLRYSNEVIARVGAIVEGASMVWRARAPWSPPMVRRLAASTGAHLDDALSLASTRVDTTDVAEALADLRAHESLDELEPALDGDEVMALLGVGPGVAVGEALAFLRALRIEEGALAPDVARARLTSWWSERERRE
jgi:poly(A) polymerase